MSECMNTINHEKPNQLLELKQQVKELESKNEILEKRQDILAEAVLRLLDQMKIRNELF